ncbi:gasdermin Eb [Stegastes partitus]|uniref:Gasdermin Eb n=1 Tax=Stegastes partitus TaxID=144197 RepID=A0A9Y4KEE8_9TELE|nr:PREDICTED: non-syndromic hearing impairment protein 5 [Stegastes partitus]
MFAIATRNFVEEVDNGGLLIPVSSVNDSDSIAPLRVVVKRKRYWFWQKHKYLPTDFVLSDLLTGDTPIKPVVVETDFIKFTGTFGDNIQGGVNASFVRTSANVGGKRSAKLQSLFGSLKKEEVDVQKLLRDSKDRVLDMSHDLIQQTKEKPRQLLGIVKECIVTTQPCSVIEEVQQGGQCGASLTICGPNSTKLCLMSNTDGGFEVDGPVKKGVVSVCRAAADSSANSHLHQELEKLSDNFQLLSALPESTRSSLLQQITKLMQDRAAISALQSVLDHMCLNKKPNLSDVATTESQRQNIQVILDLLEQCGQEGSAQSTSVLTALHLITSALDEMTNDCLATLGMCCSPAELQTLERLVQCVCGNGELPLSSAGLTENIYEKAEHLFASSNVSLKKDGDVVKTEINPEPGHLPLVLCIAVRGLASLAHSV